jgi:DNA-binding transcriptional regulator LsrR (DeoR family)
MVRDGTATNGEKNAFAKLTEQDVLSIRDEYSSGGVTQQQLAAKYAVSRRLISYIVNRKRWKHI